MNPPKSKFDRSTINKRNKYKEVAVKGDFFISEIRYFYTIIIKNSIFIKNAF